MARFFGDWDKFRRWVDRIKFGVFREKYQKEMEALGRAIDNKVRGHIIRQDLRWIPLSSATIERKGHRRVYFETGEYSRSIRTQVKPVGRFSLELSVTPQGSHSGSGLPMGQLAGILEYGTSKIPSRPIWRPTFTEVENMPEFAQLTDLGVKFGFDV
jgi:hypothetical protein